MKKYIPLVTMLVLIAALTACNSNNRYKIEGKIAGANDSTKLWLEASSNGDWYTVDSTRANGSGDFQLAEDAPEYPNIYRLRCGDKSIYFPVDSTETLSITTSIKAFDTHYTITGSSDAEQVAKIDKQAMKYAGGRASQATLEAWKKKLAADVIIKDPASMVSYYLINKYIDNRPLYDPMNDFDMKIIGAVANAFNSYRKGDPRTQYLVQMTLDGQRRRREAMGYRGTTMQAEQINLIDIKLQDANGKIHSLAQESGHGKVTLLNFTMYDQQFSPALNKLLNDLYKQYNGKLHIFQVGLDENVSQWREAAHNLPWTAVYDADGQSSRNASAYQVTQLPTVFIIDSKGEIVERVENMLQLQNKVAKYM